MVVQVSCARGRIVHVRPILGAKRIKAGTKMAAPILIRTAAMVRRDFISRLGEPRIAPATLSLKRTVACSSSWLSSQIHSDSARCYLPGSGMGQTIFQRTARTLTPTHQNTRHFGGLMCHKMRKREKDRCLPGLGVKWEAVLKNVSFCSQPSKQGTACSAQGCAYGWIVEVRPPGRARDGITHDHN